MLMSRLLDLEVTASLGFRGNGVRFLESTMHRSFNNINSTV